MKIIETIALITINETLIFQLLSFLLLLFILNRIMIRPLRRVMGEREALMDRISQDISSAEEAYQDLGRQIARQENAARSEAMTMRESIENSGKQTAAEVMDQAKAQISAIKTKAKQKIMAELEQARQEIEKEAPIISEHMIVSLLGRRSMT
jgi:F-type H+-transporting ATPase subunit b